MAKEDIRLAGQALAELEEARRAINRTQSFLAIGVGIDNTSADSELLQAEQLLESQNYEEAIRRAGAAISAARHAQNVAAQEAEWRRMQEEAEIRRRNAAYSRGPGISAGALAAGAAAGAILERMTEGATVPGPAPAMSAPEPDPGEPEREPATASGSWSSESESAEGSW
jgi:hypothetical protein